MNLPEVAHLTTRERLAHLVDVPQAEVRRGDGWLAVRTGISSNDDNVVLSVRGAPLDGTAVDDILEWLRGVPATWNVDAYDEQLTGALLDRGARSERSGWWCGRPVILSAATGWELAEVTDEAQVDAFLDVLQACGWFDVKEREAQRAAMARHTAFRHVVAFDQNRVVGVATGFAGTALEIVDVAVRPDGRRRGAARALVGDLERWGADRGTTEVFAAPSPDGANLFRALGFGFTRVVPDVCFYLP